MNRNNELYINAFEQLATFTNFKEKYRNDYDEMMKKGFVVSQIEIDETLPDTPVDTGFVLNSEIPRTSVNLIAYCIALGLYPVVYQGENDGKLLRHVVPRRNMESAISSYGSKETFFPHVDNPDLKLRGEDDYSGLQTLCPDTLTLLCLRRQENVFTSILLLEDVLCELSDNELMLLQDKVFHIRRPASFDSSYISDKQSLLLKNKNGEYLSRFDYHNVSTDSEAHNQVLQKFKKLSTDKSKWVSLDLQPGQMVTFLNQKTMHTRNGFLPKFNGKDRWLIRVFGLMDKPAAETLVSAACGHHLKTL